MRIAVVCIHYPVASGRYIAEAFRRLGHDVRTLGRSTGSEVWGVQVNPAHAWTPNGTFTESWPDWTPDLIVLAESAFKYHHPVYKDVPHVVWGVDNHVRDYTSEGIAHYFLAHKAVSVQQYNEAVTWLPCAYDPTLHTPSPIPYSRREYDVALVGVMYPQRAALVEELKAAGFRVFAATGLLYRDYVAAYHNSRVSLCVSACGDVAQRVFESAAMDCLVVSDDCADYAALRPDGIARCETAHLAEIISDVLADSEGAKWMLSLSAAWVKPHTWDSRAQVVIDWYKERYEAVS